MEQSSILSARIDCPVAQETFSLLATAQANQSNAYLILFFHEGTTRYQYLHNFQMVHINCNCKCCTSTLQDKLSIGNSGKSYIPRAGKVFCPLVNIKNVE